MCQEGLGETICSLHHPCPELVRPKREPVGQPESCKDPKPCTDRLCMIHHSRAWDKIQDISQITPHPHFFSIGMFPWNIWDLHWILFAFDLKFKFNWVSYILLFAESASPTTQAHLHTPPWAGTPGTSLRQLPQGVSTDASSGHVSIHTGQLTF